MKRPKEWGENIRKAKTGKKRPDMVGNTFALGRIPHNKGVHKPYAYCEVCSKQLRHRRAKRCKKCVDKSYSKSKPNGNTGRRYKLVLTPEQLSRRVAASTGRKMSESAKAKMREWHIKNPNRKYHDTGIEKLMEECLSSHGVSYQKQVPLCGVARVDFYLPEYRIVIQCDGCYWHNCPIHYPNHHTEQRNKDIKKDSVLQFHGYTVYRFWEHEINTSAEKCFDKIELL